MSANSKRYVKAASCSVCGVPKLVTYQLRGRRGRVCELCRRLGETHEPHLVSREADDAEIEERTLSLEWLQSRD